MLSFIFNFNKSVTITPLREIVIYNSTLKEIVIIKEIDIIKDDFQESIQHTPFDTLIHPEDIV